MRNDKIVKYIVNVDLVNRRMKEMNLGLNEFAEKSGISATTLSFLLRRDVTNATINTLGKIKECLDVSFDELIIKNKNYIGNQNEKTIDKTRNEDKNK